MDQQSIGVVLRRLCDDADSFANGPLADSQKVREWLDQLPKLAADLASEISKCAAHAAAHGAAIELDAAYILERLRLS